MKDFRRTLLLTAVLIIMRMLSQTAIAHDGPEEVIATLNAAILHNGPTADLHFRRASEFRAMREYKRAAADLGYAIRLDSSMEIARLELARLQLQLLRSPSASTRGVSDFSEPLETVKPILHSHDPSIRIASLALCGEIHFAACNWSSAIDDLSAALEHRPEVQWYLWRAEAQQCNNQHIAGVEGLRAADAETQSPVIKAALCDALIEAVRYLTDSDVTDSDISSDDLIREATNIIQLELSTSRLKSAWQIRHAELLLLCDHRQLAELELHAAVEELNARLQTQRPDSALIRDHARAVKLLNP
ncbi:MAG: hypothetical protein WKF77_00135 [Planctomycetaceae bacterium]